MEIIFVRHAEPDYILADEYKMNQIEKNFAPLTKKVDCQPRIFKLIMNSSMRT